jgi:mRNA-degrading endonuclease RelE of RelBE toxin-antitoxin system
MIIIETPIFTKQLLATLSDDEYRLFQNMLLTRPDAGKVIPGSGGLRKLRWTAEGRGKRGGLRVIYYAPVHLSKERTGQFNDRPA